MLKSVVNSASVQARRDARLDASTAQSVNFEI